MKMRKAVLKEWNDLPSFMRIPEVRIYWEILDKKRAELAVKRMLDAVISSIMLLFLVVPMALIGVLIKLDSPGTVFYRQERVTTYGRRFQIHKFRTMVMNADKKGSAVTTKNDRRITRVGAWLRKYRLDELPQLIDILKGDMSFVGTRPEVARYVKRYRPEYRATLLLPAGVTSEASIRYKDEEKLLDKGGDIDEVYIEKIVPGKMKWNLDSIRKFTLSGELLTMARTVLAVLGKEYV